MNNQIKSKALIGVLLFSAISFLLTSSCSKRKHTNVVDPYYEGVKYDLNGGYVQKGPFYSDSEIIIQELNSALDPIDNMHETLTDNFFGHYVHGNRSHSKYVEVIAEGYYFNEVRGISSDDEITLRSLVDASNDTMNVNILTTLSDERIKYLLSNEQKSFSEARQQAEQEVLEIFNISNHPGMNFNEMDMCRQGDGHAILLAASVMLQGN